MQKATAPRDGQPYGSPTQPGGMAYGADASDESLLLKEGSSYALSSSWKPSFACLLLTSLDDI